MGASYAVGAFCLLLFGTALLADIPSPAIGAIVIFAVYKLLGFRELKEIFSQSKAEFVVAITCFAGLLLLGTLRGLFVAFLLSLINSARQSPRASLTVLANPDHPEKSLLTEAEPGTETVPGIIVVRLSAPIFFANAVDTSPRIMELVAQAPHPVHTVISDFEGVSSVDFTGAKTFHDLRAKFRSQGINVLASRIHPELAEILHQFELLQDVAVYETNREAFIAAKNMARHEGFEPPTF